MAVEEAARLVHGRVRARRRPGPLCASAAIPLACATLLREESSESRGPIPPAFAIANCVAPSSHAQNKRTKAAGMSIDLPCVPRSLNWKVIFFVMTCK